VYRVERAIAIINHHLRFIFLSNRPDELFDL